MVAKERIAEMVNIMSLTISQGLTCFELSDTEFSYTPPVSMVIFLVTPMAGKHLIA